MGVVPVPGAPAPPAPATGTRRASLAFGSVQGAPVPRQFGDFTGKDGDFIRKKSGDLTQKTGISPAKKVGEFTQMAFPHGFQAELLFHVYLRNDG